MSDLENSSTYFNVNEFNEHFDANTFNVFNALHLNISSLSYNIDQLSTILSTLKVKFNSLDITESRPRTDKQTINIIDLEGYMIESTPTAASCGGALLYINKNINFKTRNDLKIYKYKERESVFIEIINRKGKKYYNSMHIQTSMCGSNSLMMFFSKTFLKNFLTKIKKSLSWVILILIS